MGGSKNTKLVINGKRVDGRTTDELRDIKIVTGVIPAADGSAFIEWGGNKILCGVYGPRECIPRHGESPYKATLKCRYMMSPFSSLEEHGRSGPSRRSTELSKVIREAFENVIILERFPNAQIEIYLDVLQADGGTRTASLTAATVALANAGIPMRDMVAAVAVGKADDILVLDLDKGEDNLGQSDMPVAMSMRDKKLLLIQMDGLLTREEIAEMLDMVENGCNKINTIQVDALRKHYENNGEDNFTW